MELEETDRGTRGRLAVPVKLDQAGDQQTQKATLS